LIRLYHRESATRSRAPLQPDEIEQALPAIGKFLINGDPYYNRNLRLNLRYPFFSSQGGVCVTGTKPADTSDSDAIFVLGMHRSGTSCVTGSLVLAGATAGYNSELTGVSVENPNGFWERRDLRNFCDMLLQGSNADWWKLSAFSTSDIAPELRENALTVAAEATRQLNRHRPWIAKEPRFCLVLPVLLELVPNPVCIHIFRDPLEVAQSLKTRDSIPIQQGIALWEFYNHMAIRNSEHLRVVRVSYASLLRNPKKAVNGLIERLGALGITGLHEPDADELSEFVDDILHRQRAFRGEADKYLTKAQRELWDRLRSTKRLKTNDIPPISDATIAALEGLEITKGSMDRARELKTAVGEKEAQIKRLQRTDEGLIAPLRKQLQRLESRLDSQLTQQIHEQRALRKQMAAQQQTQLAKIERLENELRDTSGRLRERFREIAELTRLLMDKDRQIGHLNRELQIIPRGLANSRLFRRVLALRRNREDKFHIRVLEGSELFDSAWYLQQYPDVERSGMSPALHYLRDGSQEGRNPGPLFDTNAYLQRNPDVMASGMNPLVHYLSSGQSEGRDIGFSLRTAARLQKPKC
jgi:hypothetical protein